MTTLVKILRRSNARAPGKGLHVALWVVQIAAAAMFLMAGAGKLSGDPAVIGMFDALGLGQWFRYFTSVTELTGAALLLVPALSGFGALLLSAVMVGALITHAILGGSALMAFVLLLAMAFVAWGRRDRTLALLERLV